MEFGTYMNIIIEAGKLPKKRELKTREVFIASNINVSDDTIHKWLTNRRPTYDKPIDRWGFIKYFQIHTFDTWSDIQSAFDAFNKKGSNIYKYEYINCTTKDSEVFYISLLNQLYYLLHSAPVNLQHIAPSKCNIIGRTQELENINDLFDKNNIVVLTGMGGMGKSAIASEYSHCLNTEKWTVQHVVCDDMDNIRDAILKLEFDNLKELPEDSPETRFINRLELLKNNLKPVLIILDNFNISRRIDCESIKINNNKYLHHVRFIITTRNSSISEHASILNLNPLKEDDLMSLYAMHRFSDHTAHTNYLVHNKKFINKLFSLVQNNTLIITLLAKLILTSGIDETTLLDQLSAGLKFPEESITMFKDNIDYEESIYDILRVIFNISNLSDTEKLIMTYMSLIPIECITISTFLKLTDTPRNSVQNLINHNWIARNEETFRIYLHPLICDVIINHEATKPSAELCSKFFKEILELRNNYDQHSTDWHMYNKILAHITSRYTFTKIRDYKFTDNPDLSLFNILKPEYGNPLLAINKELINYINEDIYSSPRFTFSANKDNDTSHGKK